MREEFGDATSVAVWTGIGRSMLPSILPGSHLHLARRGSAGDGIEVGDVVCFLDGSKRFVAHRVIGIADRDGARTLTVAGDGGGGREPLDEAAVVGVVTRVEHPLLSYDTRGRIGGMLARWALGRTASFRGALLASDMMARVCSIGSRLIRCYI